MTTTKIRAKKIYRNIGKSTGKKYTKILSFEGIYYTYWGGHIAQETKEGMIIDIDINPKADAKGNFTINKIISFEDIKEADKKPEMSADNIAENVAIRLHKAKQIVAKEFNLSESEVNPDSYVLSEVLHQLYSSIWLTKEMK